MLIIFFYQMYAIFLIHFGLNCWNYQHDLGNDLLRHVAEQKNKTKSQLNKMSKSKAQPLLIIKIPLKHYTSF